MRPYRPQRSSFSFGPGPLSPALKAIIGTNVALFVLTFVFPPVEDLLGLVPYLVVRRLEVWRLVTYLFIHGGVFHIFFNMFALWMFGGELEAAWGTRFFVKFYFVTGIGAGILTVLFSMLPFEFAAQVFGANVIGASGAIYGLLLAYALAYPDRPIYLYMLFPIPAKVFVAILCGIELMSSVSSSRSGVANATHLGGLAVGYLYLKGARIHPLLELSYRYQKWRIGRARKKFDIYSGGRTDDWKRRIH